MPTYTRTQLVDDLQYRLNDLIPAAERYGDAVVDDAVREALIWLEPCGIETEVIINGAAGDQQFATPGEVPVGLLGVRFGARNGMPFTLYPEMYRFRPADTGWLYLWRPLTQARELRVEVILRHDPDDGVIRVEPEVVKLKALAILLGRETVLNDNAYMRDEEGERITFDQAAEAAKEALRMRQYRLPPPERKERKRR